MLEACAYSAYPFPQIFCLFLSFSSSIFSTSQWRNIFPGPKFFSVQFVLKMDSTLRCNTQSSKNLPSPLLAEIYFIRFFLCYFYLFTSFYIVRLLIRGSLMLIIFCQILKKPLAGKFDY